MNRVDIPHAIEILKSNQVVAIPTETVYGLAGMINSEEALKSIFTTKERPLFDPLIVHVSSFLMAKNLVKDWNRTAEILAQNFWPGPLTLILEKNDSVNPLITAGLMHVGLRMPNHPLTLELIEKLQTPLAAPSANKFKKTSPTSSQHVYDEFGNSVAVIEGGSSQIGIESTVAQIFENEVVIYRPGDITAKMIKETLETNGLQEINVRYGSSPVAPGQLEEHYRPNSPLILIDEKSSQDQLETELQMANIDRDKLLHFELPDSPELSARIIYQKMRELSLENPSAIVFHLPLSIHTNENWFGVINRLTKACSFNFLSI